MQFSVIVPVYNVEEYIGECIESVMNQTYSDFEIVLVNDGSTDNSGKICNEYKKKYSDKIEVIHQKNQGPLLARVEGIKKATGDVLVFLDADDCLRKDCLVLLNNKFQTNCYDMIIFNASTEKDFSKPFREYCLDDDYVFENETKNVLYKNIITSSEMNNMCTKAIKRHLIDTTYDYNKFAYVRHGEDLLQLLPIVTKAEKILLMNQNLYYYRQRTGSLVHKFDINRNQSLKIVHQELERFIDIWHMQMYRKKHYAREVKGWIATLRLLMNEKGSLDKNQYNKLLIEMANDSYFVKAYESMDKNELDKICYNLATWLYDKKFIFLEIFRIIRNICVRRKNVK